MSMPHNVPMAEITYRITEEDYIAAQRLYRRRARSWQRYVLYGITLLGLVIAAIALFAGQRPNWTFTVVGLAYASMPWWIHKVLTEPLARRNFRKYPAIQQPQTLRLLEASEPGGDAEGVTVSAPSGESRLQWALITRWVDDEHYLLMFLQPHLYYIVPKSADPHGAVIPRLKTLLAQHVGPSI